MAFDFKNVYNKAFAEPGTKINKKLNKVIGKEVFQDIKKRGTKGVSFGR